MNGIDYAKSCLEKHGIGYNNIEKANAGFINDIYIADSCVVKVFKGEQGALERERFVYDVIRPEFAPKLLAMGEDYLILQRINGSSIFHLWPDMTREQRENTVKQVCLILNQLSKTDLAAADCVQSLLPWKDYVIGTIKERLNAARESGGVDEELSKRLEDYIAEHQEVLDEAAPSLVYADAHFDNFLFEGEKLYLIDYEMIYKAPFDYTLDVFKRMELTPNCYANEEDDPRQLKEDYADLMKWVRKYSPKMFENSNTEKRIGLYGIMYELDSLTEYPRAKLPKERLLKYLDM